MTEKNFTSAYLDGMNVCIETKPIETTFRINVKWSTSCVYLLLHDSGQNRKGNTHARQCVDVHALEYINTSIYLCVCVIQGASEPKATRTTHRNEQKWGHCEREQSIILFLTVKWTFCLENGSIVNNYRGEIPIFCHWTWGNGILCTLPIGVKYCI